MGATLAIANRGQYADGLETLLVCPVSDLACYEIAVMNLLCAQGLPGAEDLDIPQCLNLLDRLAAFCGQELKHYHYGPDSTNEVCRTEARFRTAVLVQNLKKNYGAHYDPQRLRECDLNLPGNFADSRDMFINGLLGPTRAGTCNSIPVFVTAVARRLGYPVKLICTRHHISACWDSPEERFNIEASNPMGMTIQSDDHYRHSPEEMSEIEIKSGYYLRPFEPADDLAMFMFSRVMCLEHNHREDEAIPFMARTVMLAPDEPVYPRFSFRVTDALLRTRYRKLYPDRHVPDPKAGDPLALPFDPREVLNGDERFMYMTIMGHYCEARGSIHQARGCLEIAFTESGRAPQYREDLERFCRKSILRGSGRKFRVDCRPDEEHWRLRRLAETFEKQGEFLKARDAFAETYLLNSEDFAAFEEARRIEKRAEYQRQLEAVEAARPGVG